MHCLAFDGGTNSADAFGTALLRAEETGLGILVYTLVTILVWPTSTRSELDKAALTVMRTQLQAIETLTRSLFETIAGIKGFGPASVQPNETAAPTAVVLPDPDRILAAVRAMSTLWLAYLVWIYVEVPGGSGFVMAIGSLGMTLATNPQIRASMLLQPALEAIAFAALLYVFVMPQLASFTDLGAMIFAVTFIICYLYSEPRQGLQRALGLAMFLMITGISNEQSYNFLSVIDTSIMFLLLIGLLALAVIYTLALGTFVIPA